MLCLLKTERRRRSTTGDLRLMGFYYCNVYHRYGWLLKYDVDKGKATTGRNFNKVPLKECDSLKQFLDQYKFKDFAAKYQGKYRNRAEIIVMEIIGEELPRGLIIDHLNGSIHNDVPSNLEIVAKNPRETNFQLMEKAMLYNMLIQDYVRNKGD